MTSQVQQQDETAVQSARLEIFESLISQFQELLSVRDLAVSNASDSEFEGIDEIFSPIFDALLRKMDEDIEQHGPLAAKPLAESTNAQGKIAA